MFYPKFQYELRLHVYTLNVKIPALPDTKFMLKAPHLRLLKIISFAARISLIILSFRIKYLDMVRHLINTHSK